MTMTQVCQILFSPNGKKKHTSFSCLAFKRKECFVLALACQFNTGKLAEISLCGFVAKRTTKKQWLIGNRREQCPHPYKVIKLQWMEQGCILVTSRRKLCPVPQRTVCNGLRADQTREGGQDLILLHPRNYHFCCIFN